MNPKTKIISSNLSMIFLKYNNMMNFQVKKIMKLLLLISSWDIDEIIFGIILFITQFNILKCLILCMYTKGVLGCAGVGWGGVGRSHSDDSPPPWLPPGCSGDHLAGG